MSTNVESWGDVASLGAIYPFPGIEWLLVLVAVILWLGWHGWHVRSENAEYDEALRHYREIGLDKALDHRGNHDGAVGGR